MSYHFIVVKTKNGKNSPIPIEDVKKFIDQNEDIEYRTDKRGNFLITFVEKGKEENSIFFRDGVLWCEGYSRKVLCLLIDMAEEFEGRVRGEEFESYADPDSTYIHEDDQLDRDKLTNVRKKIKNKILYRKFMAVLIIPAFLVMIFLIIKVLFDF